MEAARFELARETTFRRKAFSAIGKHEYFISSVYHSIIVGAERIELSCLAADGFEPSLYT